MWRTWITWMGAMGATVLPATAAWARPLADASVQARGAVQLEIGGAVGDEGGRRQIAMPAQLAVGLGRGVEAWAGGTALHVDADGMQVTDLAAGARIVVHEGSLQQGAGPSVAMEVSFAVPAGRAEAAAVSLGTVASHRWDAGALHVGAAVSLDDAAGREVSASTAAEGPADWRVRPVALLGFTHARGAGSGVAGRLGGVVDVTAALTFDLTGGVAAGARAVTAYDVALGLTLRVQP
jgi:hypothetical protein